MNIFGDSGIQSLKSGKTRKSGLVPMSRQEKLRIYFWCSLPYLKHDKKPLIHILSLRWSETKNLKISTPDNIFFLYLIIIKLCTLKQLEDIHQKLKLKFS